MQSDNHFKPPLRTPHQPEPTQLVSGASGTYYYAKNEWEDVHGGNNGGYRNVNKILNMSGVNVEEQLGGWEAILPQASSDQSLWYKTMGDALKLKGQLEDLLQRCQAHVEKLEAVSPLR